MTGTKPLQVQFDLAELYGFVDRDRNRHVAELSKLIDLGRDKMTLVPWRSRRGVHDFDFYTALRNARAEAYSQAGSYDLAIKDYDDGLIYFPKSAYLFSARGDVKLHSRINFSGALDDYDEALSLSPKYLQPKLGKLGALESLGKFDEVISLATEMLDPLFPTGKEGAIYQARARSYRKLGKTKLAFQDFKTVFDIGSEFDRNKVYNFIIQGGYLQKPYTWEKGEVPDFQSKVVTNGLEACVVDPECHI